MKYPFYQIGVDEPDLIKTHLVEKFGIKHLKDLPDRLKLEAITLLRLMANMLESELKKKEAGK